MKILGKAGDRLLQRFVPKTHAQAAPCDQCYTKCEGIRLYNCCRDRCAGTPYKCVYVGPECA